MQNMNDLNDLFEGGVCYEFAGRLDAVYALGKALTQLYFEAGRMDDPKNIVVTGDSEGRLIIVRKDGIDIRPFLKGEEEQ